MSRVERRSVALSYLQQSRSVYRQKGGQTVAATPSDRSFARPVHGSMRSFSRVIARLKALSTQGLAPELIVPEMAILMAHALGAATFPAVFVFPTRQQAVAAPEAFTVWLGADQTVRELRQLLKMGIWPGPRDTPSLQTIMA